MGTYFQYPTPELQEELRKIAQAIVTPGKGILAADESTGRQLTFFFTLILLNTLLYNCTAFKINFYLISTLMLLVTVDYVLRINARPI